MRYHNNRRSVVKLNKCAWFFFQVFVWISSLTLSAQDIIRDTAVRRIQADNSRPHKINEGPVIDTVKSSYPDSTAWVYKMEQSDDHWSRLTKRSDFQMFFKVNFEDGIKPPVTTHVSFYGNGSLFWLNNNNKDVEIAAAGVTAENAGNYIYHVVMNDSIELLPWSKPTSFRTNRHMTYAYLGKFETRNKLIKVEFYNIKNYQEKITWVFNGLYMPKPTVEFVVLNYNNRYLSKPYMQVHIPRNKKQYFTQGKADSKAISFNWSDSINNVQVIIKNTLQNDMYGVYLKRTIDEKTDSIYISNVWGISPHRSEPELNISSAHFNKPGNYEIIVVPEAPDEFGVNSMDKAVSIPFTVLPAKTQSFSGLQLLLIIGSIILLGSVLFLIYYLIHKRREARMAQQKEMATLQLQSVRSQLNPHFMFNALAGIQNLMNKGDISATNRYLSMFSRITRHVLDDKNKEVITVNEEVSLLEDYLQMEQMRFGFEYKIHVDERIDRANTEIPSMLLQPYIENAVKHGVSSLKTAGIIVIAILLQSGTLVMEVKDNGNGYDTNANMPGNGTALTQKRVDLINQINKKDTIIVSKRSDNSGTTISIQLNEWV